MKKLLVILPLVLVICFVVGCQDKEAMAELEEFRAQVEVEEQNEEAIINALKFMDEGKPEEGMKFFSPDCIFHTGGFDYSSEEYSEHAAIFYTAFTSLKHEIIDAIAAGDKVVLNMIESGTHEGDFMGIAPTGKIAKWPTIAIYRFSNNVVEEVWVELDMLGIQQQLAMELKPKDRPDLWTRVPGSAGKEWRLAKYATKPYRDKWAKS